MVSKGLKFPPIVIACIHSGMTLHVPRHRIASVSFLNARPLIYGLDRDPQVSLQLDVPSRLLDCLQSGSADVALLPTIDYQRMDDLQVIPAGGIGCDGQTLTVRIFARQPIETIRSLACDTDSHTSVALARIILGERYGIRPEFVEGVRSTGKSDEAVLLIGDKVVCEEPAGYSHQYDLGEEWKVLTGLPFVFAVWTSRAGLELGDLPDRLTKARQDGLQHVDELIEQFGTPRGWPLGLARQYLTEYLQFQIESPQLEAIRRFHELARKYGIIPSVRPLRVCA